MNTQYPSRYICYICGLNVDVKSQNVLRRVRGWARGQTKTLGIVEQEDYMFVHEFCMPGKDKESDQIQLF